MANVCVGERSAYRETKTQGQNEIHRIKNETGGVSFCACISGSRFHSFPCLLSISMSVFAFLACAALSTGIKFSFSH